MYRLVNDILSDRVLQVVLNDEIKKFRHLNNGLPQGSDLAPLLVSVYILDIPKTACQKFMYADDVALATQNKQKPQKNPHYRS